MDEMEVRDGGECGEMIRPRFKRSRDRRAQVAKDQHQFM
jgi:hypothetical protein